MSGSFRRIALGGTLLLFAAACATTEFTSTWKDPTAQAVSPAGKTIAALWVSRDEAKRRAAEDSMVRAIDKQGARGVASYTIVSAEGLKNTEQTREQLRAAGCDGVVVMRVIGQQEKLSYTPGTYYGGAYPYYGAWGYGWGGAYSPGYLTQDTEVSVQILVYSLTQDKLIWAGTTKTLNPSNVDSFVNELAEAVVWQMNQDGLLVKK